jgi:hypothetical protein
MSYYYVGDTPHEPLIVLPELNGVPQELHGNDTADVLCLAPDGTEITTLTAEVQGNHIDVIFPETSIFDTAGIYTIIVTIDHIHAHESEGIEQVDPVRIVADDSTEQWATLAITRASWVDARAVDDDVLYEILQIAKHQVIEYAPALAEDADVPQSYRLGQILQARNTYNSSIVDASSGDIGADTFVIRPFPLDWQVKQLLRPRRGNPVVG